jgi:glycosyltransferase involved in cell wall biosynthesis
MKIVLINTFDIAGGAAIATYRLHKGLRKVGMDSTLLVQTKKSDDFTVFGSQTRLERLFASVRPYLDAMINRIYRKRQRALFFAALVPDSLAKRIAMHDPDIVHLFWVAGGFLRIETLKKIKTPLVWTLHDMWPFTGGCHYDDECGRFRGSCGNCPVLGSERGRDLSHYVLKRKINSWDGLPIVVVATSHWLADMARASTVFKNKRIEVIPNGIDTGKYKPIDKTASRHAWGLPADKNLILFSAFSATTDKRKGNQFLVAALKAIAAEGWGDRTELVIVGASEPEHPVDLGMKVNYVGSLGDEISQVLLYSAVDVTVAPSMQENLSNTVMESLACGTPVVAFNIGGMPDLIDHKTTGYLAATFEVDDLAAGIKWVLDDMDRHRGLSLAARTSVLEKYTLEKVAGQYIDLYKSLLQ